MRIHRFENAPPPSLAKALVEFERQFTYPLGVGRRFHISHGADYPRFFRAIGGESAASFVAINEEGEILGTLGVAIRPVQLPDGRIVTAAYLGDLKTAPDPRRARTLVQLAATALVWGKALRATAAYGVVMDGTPRSPTAYSGRFGIPAFGAAAKTCVLRLPVPAPGPPKNPAFDASAESVERRYRALGLGRVTPLGGQPRCRSVCAPMPLLAPDGAACGLLEDTRLAKRLLLDDGEEMISAHLSGFAYADAPSGAALIRQALARCVAPALFVAVPDADADDFARELRDIPGIVQAPATIYAAGFSSDKSLWNLCTAEI